MGRYLTAQVCTNGHIVTSGLESHPEFAARFCDECGAPTITTCQSCNVGIRGRYDAPGVIALGPRVPPRHCHQCGKAYPWTQAAVDAWREMAEEAEELTPEERERLAASIDDLIADTPRTQTAVQRVKRLALKAASSTGEAMKQVLTSVATEAVKQQMGLK